jgi:hypothetical protein
MLLNHFRASLQFLSLRTFFNYKINLCEDITTAIRFPRKKLTSLSKPSTTLAKDLVTLS